MRIKIALKLRPFSHRPGIRCLVPFSTWEAEIFPTKIFFTDLANGTVETVAIPLDGPIQGFTVLQDMEKGRIEVFGRAQSRERIAKPQFGSNSALSKPDSDFSQVAYDQKDMSTCEKREPASKSSNLASEASFAIPSGYFRYFLSADGLELFKQKIALPFIRKFELNPSQKRLSLGIHKKQDWDLIQRRSEMEEVFPFWIRLAQIIPEIPLPKHPIGTAELLAQGKLEQTFQAAFQGILSPRLQDENYLGLIPEIEVPKGVSPLGILHEGARQIERLFFREENEALYFLPKLPKELHAGRFINLKLSSGDLIDIEWSKKELKKVVIHAAKSRSIKLVLQSQLHAFRLRKSPTQKGIKCSRDQIIELEEGKTLYLDRFIH